MWTILKRVLTGLALIGVGTAALAQEAYRVRPGDQLTIEVLEDNALNRSVQVLPDGRFSFPFTGPLQASGRTVSQIEASITSAIASNFTNEPNVFVSVTPDPQRRIARKGGVSGSARQIDIYFMGEVNKPGQLSVTRGTTFLQAIAQSGGMTKFAAKKRIQLRRTNKTTGEASVQSFNYKALANGATLTVDPKLQDGDVILVPERRLFE